MNSNRRFISFFALIMMSLSLTTEVRAEHSHCCHGGSTSWGLKSVALKAGCAFVAYKVCRYYYNELLQLRSDLGEVKEDVKKTHADLTTVHEENTANHHITHEKLETTSAPHTPLQALPANSARATSNTVSLETIWSYLTWFGRILRA